MDRKAVVCLHSGILLGCKKEEKKLPFVTAWLDVQSIVLSEINQSEKNKYHTSSLICGNNEQKLTNKIDTDS